MGRIYAIALNTFREAVRDRVLHGVLGGAAAVVLFSLVLAELSLNEQARVVEDVGLASISLFTVLTATFLGSSLLYKEMERKTLYVILPKPIARWEFLLGKYLGIALTGGVFVAIMGALHFAVVLVQRGASVGLILAVAGGLVAVFGVAFWRVRDRTMVVVPWAALAVGTMAAVAGTHGVGVGVIGAALSLVVGELLLLAAVAMLFSSFSTPFLTGLLTLGVWLIGRAAGDMATMKSKALGPELRALLRGLAEVVPNFNLFVPGRHTLTESGDTALGPWSYVLTAGTYAVLFAAVLLVLAALIFRRRDFL